MLFDCDDMILDWPKGFTTHLWEKFGIKVSNPHPPDFDYRTWVDWTGLSPEENLAELIRFNEESEGFGKLEPIEGAVEVLKGFHDRGDRLVVVTSCAVSKDCVERRNSNLLDTCGDIFEDIHCVPLGVSKAEYLAMYQNAFWFEDNVPNAIIGHQLGHKTLVRKVRHNQKMLSSLPAGVYCFDRWDEVHDIVDKYRAHLAA